MIFSRDMATGALISTVLAISASFFAACSTQNTASNNGTSTDQAGQVADANANTNANINVNTAPPPASSEALSKVQITLPIVDAMLADDATVSDLKAKVQLTDDQIQKLRAAGKESVSSLGEDSSGDSSRSTSSASKAAEAESREIVGAPKADATIAYFREKWAGGNFAAVTTPNAIPTDTRIVVNAPAYRMDIFRDGKLVKTYKVGIGYPEFPLPSGMRKATELVFNPTWTPPDEPWVKGKFEPGKKVEAGSKDNPLGPIKIPIGLPSLIHGGKSPGKLGGFASHGCVGLTNGQIQDFASQITGLAGDPLSLADIKGYEKNKTETKNVKLSNPVSVDLRYETIVATADGKLTIYRDVYERGTNTEDNLRRVLDAAGVSFDSLPAADQKKILAGVQQMAIDAHGDAVNTEDSVQAGNKAVMKNQTGNITRTIKGARQVVFDIPGLKGKGYPIPVNLMAA